MDGFLNLNKPIGFTSHDCVAKLRRLLNLKRIGHAGTLDPAATGVLPIALGRATRLLQYLPSDKAYQATIRFGITTATDDLAGETLTQRSATELTLTAVKAQLPQFLGEIQQIPPNYSAIQVQGKRLYDLARSGQAIAVPPRSVQVFTLEVLDWQAGEFPELTLAIACGAGTYIRSIARDLGACLGTGATLASLLRTQSSGLLLADSLTIEALSEQLQSGQFCPLSPDRLLAQLPPIVLPEETARRWRQGQKVSLETVSSETVSSETVSLDTATLPSGKLRVRDPADRFLGIGEFRSLDDQTRLVPLNVYEPVS